LVAFAVGLCVVAMDVGGQRHVSEFVETVEEVCGGEEAQGALSEISTGDDLGLQEWECVSEVEKRSVSPTENFAAGTD